MAAGRILPGAGWKRVGPAWERSPPLAVIAAGWAALAIGADFAMGRCDIHTLHRRAMLSTPNPIGYSVQAPVYGFEDSMKFLLAIAHSSSPRFVLLAAAVSAATGGAADSKLMIDAPGRHSHPRCPPVQQ